MLFFSQKKCYHSVRKCRRLLYVNTKIKRHLYSGTEWFHLIYVSCIVFLFNSAGRIQAPSLHHRFGSVSPPPLFLLVSWRSIMLEIEARYRSTRWSMSGHIRNILFRSECPNAAYTYEQSGRLSCERAGGVHMVLFFVFFLEAVINPFPRRRQGKQQVSTPPPLTPPFPLPFPPPSAALEVWLHCQQE